MSEMKRVRFARVKVNRMDRVVSHTRKSISVDCQLLTSRLWWVYLCFIVVVEHKIARGSTARAEVWALLGPRSPRLAFAVEPSRSIVSRLRNARLIRASSSQVWFTYHRYIIKLWASIPAHARTFYHADRVSAIRVTIQTGRVFRARCFQICRQR